MLNVTQITFSLKDAAEITRIPLKRLRELTDSRNIRPAVFGSRGKGNGHRLSPQQLYACAAVGALYRSPRGCSFSYVKEVFAAFEAMSDAALEEWRGGRGAEVNDYSEEAAAAWLSKPEVTLIMGDHGNPTRPSDAETVKDMEQRMARVDEAIRLRRNLKPPTDRVSDILR
jgi:hypothetical protein